MVHGLFDDQAQPPADKSSVGSGDTKASGPFTRADYTPETTEENMRRTGLAWSAGIAFFGAIVFMLFLGWLADLLLGSSPWGIVGGIVLGSIIGFMQFFRITSQIFGSNSSTPAEHPLLSQPDEPAVRRDPFDQP